MLAALSDPFVRSRWSVPPPLRLEKGLMLEHRVDDFRHGVPVRITIDHTKINDLRHVKELMLVDHLCKPRLGHGGG